MKSLQTNRRRDQRTVGPQVEVLEPRLCLNCSFSVLPNGTLQILGDNTPNTVNVQAIETATSGHGVVVASCDGKTRTFSGIQGVVVNTKGGNDTVSVAHGEKFRSVALDLGAGNDTANLTYSGGGNPDPNDRQLSMMAGTGDDEVHLMADGLRGFLANLDLGDGNNTADLRFSGGGAPDPDGLNLKVAAGLGNDRVDVLLLPGTRPVGRLSVDVNLGGGNDTGNVTYSGGGNPDPTDLPLLHVNLQGGAGDDKLALTVDKLPSAVLVDLVLDGGPGTDSCIASPNVQVLNCEDVHLPPAVGL